MPLYVVMPPEERARIVALAAKVGRPLSWTVRDALRLYLDAMEADADALGRLKVDTAEAGKTPEVRRGRPRGRAADLCAGDKLDAGLLAALASLLPDPDPRELQSLIDVIEAGDAKTAPKRKRKG